MGRMLASAVLATLVLASALAMSGSVAAEETPLDVRDGVETGPTDRYGGGDWVAFRAGETVFGVLYGTEEHRNSVVIFAEYKRYLGGAEIYDERDNFLNRRGIPVWTVFIQRFDLMVEFDNSDDSNTFDGGWLEGTGAHPNRPLKTLNLRDAWTLSDLVEERTDHGLAVGFNLSLYDKQYARIWDDPESLPRRATPEDGDVEEITFSFRLNVTKARVTVDNVPWYRVTVADGREMEIVDSEFLENRTFEGVATSVGVKYDHYFLGWDFVNNASRLALGTEVLMGQFTTEAVAQWLHAQYGDDLAHEREDAREPDQIEVRPDDPPMDKPRLLTKDSIYFDDDWYRVGRLRWVSDVEVDAEGNLMRMHFQVGKAGPVSFERGDRLFRGLALRGAFVYPYASEYILHDPEFSSTALELGIPTAYNVVPGVALVAQVAVITLAVIAAVLVALTRKLRK